MNEPNPGLCQCGCGHPTSIAPKTIRARGWIKGQPVRFVPGHHAGTGWKDKGASYRQVHTYLLRHFPKTGTCDECGMEAARTEHALIHGREYSRDRGNYRELCVKCHRTYDRTGDHHRGERNVNAKLTAAAVAEIRRRYAGGQTKTALAREYGVTRQVIASVVNGETWRHV
jgi:hypothetical protein